MSRAELYQKLLKQAAKELRCKITAEKAKNYAVLKLAREVISSKLVNGKDIDPSALRCERVDPANDDLRPLSRRDPSRAAAVVTTCCAARFVAYSARRGQVRSRAEAARQCGADQA